MANPNSPPASTAGNGQEIIEHRLALVMNGGVSLAVWMGGVACEIDNARRASNGIPSRDGATKEEQALHNLWVKATREANVRLAVDVIAGTSAGGLNGVLLAAAIARGASLAGLEKLWLDSGQMSAEALFQPQRQGTLSLMNGDFFHDQIAGELQRMTPTEHGRSVSLIVTSTALGPSARQVKDSSGQCFSEADHRRRFRFVKHGPRPQYVPAGDGYQLKDGPAVDDFTETEPLATAGRASASYPVAFKPVEEPQALRDRRVWPDWTTSKDLDWLADGGILDNSPFDPVLDSIQSRSVTGPWRRTLCFVVPSGPEAAPGRDITNPGAPADGGAEPKLPPPWTSVASAAFSFPREANFRDDIEHLHRTIRGGRSSFDVSRFRRLTAGISVAGDGETVSPGPVLAEARQICTAAISLYQQSCAAAAVYQVWDIVARARTDGYIDPVGEVSDFPVHPAGHPWLPATFPAAGEDLPGTWNWGVDAADRVVRTMLRATSGTADRDPLRQGLSQCLHQIAAIGLAVSQYLADAGLKAENAGLQAEGVIGLLDEAYETLQVGPALAPIVRTAAESYASQHLGLGAAAAPEVLAAGLAVEVSNGAGSLPSDRPRPLFDFVQIGLGEPPRLLRGAYDAALPSSPGPAGQPPDPNNILYGTRLNHFAAFGDPAWRSWDWLWGRMNALAQLADILGLAASDVDELTTAILAVEGRDLSGVQEDIGKVVGMTTGTLLKDLRAAGRFPPVFDALFGFLRSQAPTSPKVPSAVMALGQVASDVLARRGQAGQVSHHVLRTVTAIPRRLVWRRHIDPDQ